MSSCDLLIAGAGPAGLFLAIQAATINSEIKIKVFDSSNGPEDIKYYSSGSFIDPRNWPFPDCIYRPVESICFQSRNRTARKTGRGFFIDRVMLLKYLADETARYSNIELVYRQKVVNPEIKTGFIRSVELNSKNSRELYAVKSRFYADCTGVSAPLASALNLCSKSPLSALGMEYLVPLKSEPGTMDVFVGSHLPGGYGWIFPIDNQRAIIGFGTLDRKCFNQLEHYLLKLWDIPRVGQRCEQTLIKKNLGLLRTGPLPSSFYKGNTVIVGDSAIQANPLGGEGLRFVMDAASIAAPALVKAITADKPEALKIYQDNWLKKYADKYRRAYELQQRMYRYTYDDTRVDKVIDKINLLSNEDFLKLFRGDLGYTFLIKLGVKLKYFS